MSARSTSAPAASNAATIGRCPYFEAFSSAEVLDDQKKCVRWMMACINIEYYSTFRPGAMQATLVVQRVSEWGNKHNQRLQMPCGLGYYDSKLLKTKVRLSRDQSLQAL